jgi:cytochrome c peroxidase
LGKTTIILLLLSAVFFLGNNTPNPHSIKHYYLDELEKLEQSFKLIESSIQTGDKNEILSNIVDARILLKKLDPILRYNAPIQQKWINGPLPVEWETEVFEKFEMPYKRIGGGLLLLQQELESDGNQQRLSELLQLAQKGIAEVKHDTLIKHLNSSWHTFYMNRLFLLNLAAIYTTGFENPDPERVIPELITVLDGQKEIYQMHNQQHPNQSFSNDYLFHFERTVRFVQHQPHHLKDFDHFTFIRDFIRPLFQMNAQHILSYKLRSKNLIDYSIESACEEIFDPLLYEGIDTKGWYKPIKDPFVLDSIQSIGRMWFFDPIFSGNNKRSCASCHKPNEYFTDTALKTAITFDFTGKLNRNTPTLLHVNLNHLAMHDGRFYSLMHQAEDVVGNPLEMQTSPKNIIAKMNQIPRYKKSLQWLSSLTPDHPEAEFGHISSALMVYYNAFNHNTSSFDSMIKNVKPMETEVVSGFNLFMGKAQCATCHFPPHFGGVKPPYTNSEFEVLGTPSDEKNTRLSQDSGRYLLNPAPETLHAFRTPILKNVSRTAPYMHNGVFKTLEEVIDFYDAGGGAGRGLEVENQTLSSDSLHLSSSEKKQLIQFLNHLDEHPKIKGSPDQSPPSKNKKLNSRKPGGTY